MKKKLTIPRAVKAVIPYSQYQVTIEHLESYAGAIDQLYQRVQKCPKIYETVTMKEHPAVFHYFYGATDIYVCEYDGHDLMFGFTILNGDLTNSEFGYIPRSEIIAIQAMNIDYYFEEQSIEAARYKKYPDFFNKPPSLGK